MASIETTFRQAAEGAEARLRGAHRVALEHEQEVAGTDGLGGRFCPLATVDDRDALASHEGYGHPTQR